MSFLFHPTKPIDGFDDKLKNQMPSSESTPFGLEQPCATKRDDASNTAVWPILKSLPLGLLMNKAIYPTSSRGNEFDPLAWGLSCS